MQLVAAFDGDGGAEHTTTIAQHIINMFGRNQFGCHDEVAFVFAIFVVDYNHELTFLKIFYSFLNRGEFE